jgi:hypothetical protein
MLPLNPKSKMQAYPSHHFLELHLFPEKNQLNINLHHRKFIKFQLESKTQMP